MCWVYSKQKITVIVAQGPSHVQSPVVPAALQAQRKLTLITLTLKALFSDWLCFPSCVQLKLLGLYPVFQSTAGDSHPEFFFFPTCDGEVHLCLLQIAELGEGASQPTLLGGCLHYRVDVLAVDYLFSLVV